MKIKEFAMTYAVPKHLLCGLLFLKMYGTEHAHAMLSGMDEKSQSKWQWLSVNAIASLKIVSFCHPSHYCTDLFVFR